MDVEYYEDEDTQQVQQVAAVDDREVEAIFEMYLDRKRAEDLMTREYIRQTLQEGAYQTWMPQPTALNIMHQDAHWIAQACDDRQSMLTVCHEVRS